MNAANQCLHPEWALVELLGAPWWRCSRCHALQRADVQEFAHGPPCADCVPGRPCPHPECNYHEGPIHTETITETGPLQGRKVRLMARQRDGRWSWLVIGIGAQEETRERHTG